ncbi:DUF2795 domain-containing protein [Streptomyces sp. NPDC007905]|uniref:DUF2795 domain-containing protein n=1 Tax=Streptomyces sp. NPDC007905 TaxID=3364788 RepID=UPI0036E91FFE
MFTSVRDVPEALQDVTFPAGREELVQAAENAGAPEEMVSFGYPAWRLLSSVLPVSAQLLLDRLGSGDVRVLTPRASDSHSVAESLRSASQRAHQFGFKIRLITEWGEPARQPD